RLNVGTVHGGDYMNRLPTPITVGGQRRWLPGTTAAEVLAELQALCQGLADESGLTFEVALEGEREPFEAPADHPPVRALAAAVGAAADNWPAWRGPLANGYCRETGLPLKWSATENVRWKTALPGPGNSTPIVWGDRVFLTQSLDPAGRQRAVLCFDRKTGK